HGSVTFTYRATDGISLSEPATVTITVIASPQVPVAAPDTFTINEDMVVFGNVLTNDSDPQEDTLTAVLVDEPESGQLMFNANGSFAYIPAKDFHGVVTFTYRATDGVNESETALVTIEILPVNDAPVARDDAAVVEAGQTVVIDVLDNDEDVDDDALVVELVTGPEFGMASVDTATGLIHFEAPADFDGTITFTYRVNDGHVNSKVATVTVTVERPISVNPVAEPDTFTINEDMVVFGNVLTNDGDPQGDPLTAALVEAPQSGQLMFNANGSFAYIPAKDVHGFVTFTYRATDGVNESETALVTIEILPVNDAPVARDDAAVVEAGQTVVIDVLGNDEDVDGDALVVELVTGPELGMASVDTATGLIHVEVPADFDGTLTFTYRVNDGHVNSKIATVTVTVERPISVNPVAEPDTFTIN